MHQTPPVLPFGNIGRATALWSFFAFAFAWSWACWLLAPWLKPESAFAAGVLSLIGGFGPSVAAFGVVAHRGGRAGLRHWLMRCLQWRVGWHWMLLAFFLPAVLMGLATAGYALTGGTLPASPAASHLMLAALNFLLIFMLGGPLGEEFGWRGYALPVLRCYLGWRSASLVLGGVWALWHLPLFYSPGTVQSQLPMGLYALSTVASSVLFAWLYNRTCGSVLPALVLHTAVNGWSWVIPVMVMPDGSKLQAFQWVVAILVLLAAALLLDPDPQVMQQSG